MQSILGRIVVFATVDGVIIQPLAGGDHHKAIRADYERGSITTRERVPLEEYQLSPCLESHGIIGLLTIACFSFLLCITRREQVAQLFGRPVYVIKDVAILPLSSRAAASQAISQTQADLHKAGVSNEVETESFASGNTDDDSLGEKSVGDPSDSLSSQSPGGKVAEEAGSETAVVREVLERKSRYGQFASQWLLNKGWGSNDQRADAVSIKKLQKAECMEQSHCSTFDKVEPLKDSSFAHEIATGPSQSQSHQAPQGESTNRQAAAYEMLPKILRTTTLFLTSRSFYFSYDIDITKSFNGSSVASLQDVSAVSRENQFFWNRHLAAPFCEAGSSSAVLPIMQGFVGQQPFLVKKASGGKAQSQALEKDGGLLAAHDSKTGLDQSLQGQDGQQQFLLTLISRKSVNRSGLRYLRRGVDDEGHCANTVETEQILSSPKWENPGTIHSFVQVRGSIPLYFSQSPYAFKPAPVLHQAPEINQTAFRRHFEGLQQRYGRVQVVQLVDQQGGEKEIGHEYENSVNSFNKTPGVAELGFEWFDFHHECRGMKFENVQKLIFNMEETINSFGEAELDGGNLKHSQTGIIRTNCMDCLDRTNIVQSAFAQHVLQKDLERAGLVMDFMHDPSTQWLNSLWADNGDAISRHYASTAALKGDYTRTRKRNYRGALNDLGLTLTRYYHNIVNDYFLQTVIDVLLGNVTSVVFEDFEATMMSADPGVSVEKFRQNAIDTCAKIVIQTPEEERICGWALLAPAQTNTMRTLPFEEAILLLTTEAVYGCRFDWDTEKVASFERVDHRSIVKIHHGTYITSTLTRGQMKEESNVGLVISYTPGIKNIKRVNTRSLQVSDDLGTDQKHGNGKQESGVLSWLRARTQNPATTYCMAMKVIPRELLVDASTGLRPRDIAEQIGRKIQQAVRDDTGDEGLDLLEEADIISLADARSRTGYLEQIGHSIKKLVWT